MGCDIHMYAEVRKNNKWSKVGDVFENMWYSKDRELSDWNKPLTDAPYDGRNYDLFAILADVRNGRGFAGCVTGDKFNPISEPKGLPNDISKKIKKESDKWDGDGHSHSYFTVKELLDFDWEQKHISIGCLSLEDYKEMKRTNETPSSYCGDIYGRDIVVLNEEDYENKQILKLFGGSITEDSKQYYIRAKFPEVTYRECVGNFLEKTLPQLQTLGNNEDVRIVFWFDN